MAVTFQDIGTINFEVYESGTNRLLGMANVELPTIEYETVDTKGNGLGGTRAFPIRGNTGSMELKLVWRQVNTDYAPLFRHESINLSLYGATSGYEGGSGEIKVIQHRIETRVTPKSDALGKFEPSATMDNEITFEALVFYYYINGVEQLGIDWANMIHRVNGEDYSAPTRQALGL